MKTYSPPANFYDLQAPSRFLSSTKRLAFPQVWRVACYHERDKTPGRTPRLLYSRLECPRIPKRPWPRTVGAGVTLATFSSRSSLSSPASYTLDDVFRATSASRPVRTRLESRTAAPDAHAY